MAGGISALGNLPGKVNASNALVVTLDGGEASASILKLGDGTVAAPSLTFTNDLDSGWYRAGADDIRLSVGNNDHIRANGNGIAVTNLFLDVTNRDVILARDGANTLAQRNGTNAQEFRIWNSDAAIDEFLSIGFINNANVATFQTEQVGGGTVRNFAFMGGNVGIGTTTPTLFTLQVAGSIGSTSATGGIGYGTGAGGTVTQATSKSTEVSLNAVTGEITMNGASLAAGTAVTFTLTSTAIVINDHIVPTHVRAGTLGAYTVTASEGLVGAPGSCTMTVRNNTAGALAEAIILKYTVIKSVIA